MFDEKYDEDLNDNGQECCYIMDEEAEDYDAEDESPEKKLTLKELQ